MSALRFDNRVVVITGAGSGLGRCYAHYLSALGAKVLVNSIARGQPGDGELSPAARVADEISGSGGIAQFNDLSVADPRSGVLLVEQALDSWGRIDAVINNAGNAIAGEFETLTDADLDTVLVTHLHGSMRLARAAWPHMKLKKYGRIVNTCSESIYGVPGNIPYLASKSALLGFTRALAIDGKQYGIAVNAVMPTAYTPMTAQIPDEDFRMVLQSLFPTEKVAPLVAWLCHDSVDCSGEFLVAGGGRIARMFLGLTTGCLLDSDTIDNVGAKRNEFLNVENFIVPTDTADAVLLGLEKITGVKMERPNFVPS